MGTSFANKKGMIFSCKISLQLPLPCSLVFCNYYFIVQCKQRSQSLCHIAFGPGAPFLVQCYCDLCLMRIRQSEPLGVLFYQRVITNSFIYQILIVEPLARIVSTTSQHFAQHEQRKPEAPHHCPYSSLLQFKPKLQCGPTTSCDHHAGQKCHCKT